MDPAVCQDIFSKVIAGVEDSAGADYRLSPIESEEISADSQDSEALEKRRKLTKKRRREDQVLGDEIAGDLSVDSFGQIRPYEDGKDKAN